MEKHPKLNKLKACKKSKINKYRAYVIPDFRVQYVIVFDRDFV